MKICIVPSFFVLSACLFGCKVYSEKTWLEGRLPLSDGLSDKMRSACVTKPHCYVTYKLKSEEPRTGIFPSFLYARMKKTEVESKQKNVLLELMQESYLFTDVWEGDRDMRDEPLISMRVSAWIDMPTGSADRYDFSFLFDVFDTCGVRHQYRMSETVRNDRRFPNLASELSQAFDELHRKVVNTLLVKMYEDGFFSKESSRKPDAVGAEVLSAERKKNLDSLLKAGVITEEEYKKEIGKEAK